MRQRLVTILAATVLALTAIACRERDRFVIEPLEAIESVTVLSTSPPRLEVRAVVGDGCSFFQGLAQRREGAEITVTLTRIRRTTRECRDLENRFDQVVTLDGPLAPGTYNVRVNEFTVPLVVP